MDIVLFFKKNVYFSVAAPKPMEEFYSIADTYKPLQPSVKGHADGMVYQEIRPVGEIRKYVYCIWQLRTRSRLSEPYTYRVVSDGCIDIFFDHRHSTDSFIMGFCRKYVAFSIGNDFDYIGIRFLPGAFPGLFSLNAKKLSNRSVKLDSLLPDLSQWIATHMSIGKSFKVSAEILEEWLSQKIMQQKPSFDNRFLKAVIIIFEKRGYLDVATDLDIGLSPRQLRRVFNYYIGTTPKAFSNVVRFQEVLYAKPSRQSLRKQKFYYDLGFFDQAHFIKNFKTFYGITPSEAFG